MKWMAAQIRNTGKTSTKWNNRNASSSVHWCFGNKVWKTIHKEIGGLLLAGFVVAVAVAPAAAPFQMINWCDMLAIVLEKSLLLGLHATCSYLSMWTFALNIVNICKNYSAGLSWLLIQKTSDNDYNCMTAMLVRILIQVSADAGNF